MIVWFYCDLMEVSCNTARLLAKDGAPQLCQTAKIEEARSVRHSTVLKINIHLYTTINDLFAV